MREYILSTTTDSVDYGTVSLEIKKAQKTFSALFLFVLTWI